MLDSLHTEFQELLAPRVTQLKGIMAIRDKSERADGLVLFCRELVRLSSLCYIEDVLCYFGGRVYESIKPSSVITILFNVLVDAGVSPSSLRSISDMPLSVLVEKSYRKQNYIAFNNGVLDLDSSTFVESFSPETRVTESLNFDYDVHSSCPLWEKFLSEVMPDGDSRLALQEFFGMVYLNRDHFSVEKFAIFVGRGANGKSVIFEVIKRVIGPDYVTTLDSSQLTDERMLPYVKGARLNFSPDMARQKDFTSALKALASGQDVTGRRIYGDAEKIKCPPLCFAMNELPLFKDATDAFFRRILLFKFDVQIPPHRQDKRLVDRICMNDLPGIFNWMLQGRFRLMRRNGEFTFSEKMDKDLSLIRSRVQYGSDFPVRTYLESRGLSVYPSQVGQATVLVSRNEIFKGLNGSVSNHAITRELNNFGVQAVRSKDMQYRVYEKIQ